MNNEDTFGSRVRALRKQRGWSQEDLAREAYVSNTTISNLESGYYNPGASTLRAIAAALDTPEEELAACLTAKHCRDVKLKDEHRQLLKAIIEYKVKHSGDSPSLRTLMRLSDYRSTSSIYNALRNLRWAGLVEIHETGGGHPSIHVVGERYTPPADWQEITA